LINKIGAEINSFDVGDFAFYRDPDLTMKLSSENLFDQLTPDGWVSIYFAGQDKYLPNFGTFKTHVITNKTFYWDIIDENGKRTKTGLEQMWISRNKNMSIWYGDLIPTTPSDNFNYYDDATVTDDKAPLITSNLWFYNNLFLDNYFRYYVILLPKGKTWPDETNALILPMNDGLYIPKGYYIVGYRPKPEYRYQLATMPIIKSGKDFAIHFQFKLDMEYLISNPNAKRYIKIFSSVKDKPRYLLFPQTPLDIVWTRFNEPFIGEFKSYMLKYGIQQNLPSKKEINFFLKKKEDMFKFSNIIDSLDSLNFSGVVEQLKNKKKDSKFVLTGIADYVYDAYKEWANGIEDKTIKRDVNGILSYILFNKIPWAGFRKLYNAVNDIVIKVKDDDNPEHFRPTPKSIIEINGVKQFEDGWVPKRAIDYRYPPEGYIYAGDTGNGMYVIEINGKPYPVLCDMENGGWMLVMDPMLAGKKYVANFIKDHKLPEHLIANDYGVSFGGGVDKPEVMFYPEVHYQQLKIGYVDWARKCGEFKTEIYSESHMFLFNQSLIINGKCFSDLAIDNNIIYSNNTQDEANYYKTAKLDKVQTTLTVKMTPGKNFEDVRKYVKVIWAK